MGEIRFVDTGETRGFPYLVCKIDRVFAHVLSLLQQLDNFIFIIVISTPPIKLFWPVGLSILYI